MHIAIDARFINSGTGTYVRELLNHLQDIDTTNLYSVLVLSKDLNYWQPKNSNFKIVAADFDFYSLEEQFGFKKFLDELKPDLVHFGMPQQPVWYRGKKVTTMHDLTLLNTYNSDKNWLIFHLKQLVGKWVFKKISKTNDHIIAISHNTKQEYQEFSGIADEKISVIYEAGEAKPGEIEPYELPLERYIIYVGQQPDYKNIRRLGDAHQILLDKYPDLGLVLVGRKKDDALRNEKYFNDTGYKNIHFTDFVPDSQRDYLFKNAVCYVFPSLMEGFGLPPLEAMSYGTPVVSSNESCMPEILGEAAYYFDPLDVSDIANKVSEVIDDEKLRANMTEKGYAQVAKYSWRRMAEQTHAVYLKVLNDN